MVFPQQTKRDATPMFRMWVTMTIKDTKNISNVVYLINLSVFKFDSNKHLKGHQSAEQKRLKTSKTKTNTMMKRRENEKTRTNERTHANKN